MIKTLKIIFIFLFLTVNSIAGSDGEVELSKKNDSIKAVFDTARNYIHLEDDENSPFRNITMKQDFIGALEFTIDADTKNYKHSVLCLHLLFFSK